MEAGRKPGGWGEAWRLGGGLEARTSVGGWRCAGGCD